MVRPTAAFGFPSHRVVLYLQQSKQISCPQIPGIPGAGPGSASQQAGEDYAAESSTVCTNEALITFRYFLKPHWSDFRYKLCQVAPPSFKSVSIGKATLDYLPWQNFLQQTLLLKPPLVCLSRGWDDQRWPQISGLLVAGSQAAVDATLTVWESVAGPDLWHNHLGNYDRH